MPATVLITGGARGLGLVFANLYAERGARVAICSRTEEELESALRSLKSAHPAARIRAYVCDVSNTKCVTEMIDSIERELGPVDILVNNAGWILSAPLETMTEEDFQRSMNSNLWGTIRTSLAVIPRMKERKQGKILNVTSIGGVVPVPHLAAYATAKFGAVGFSTALAVELKKYGISVTTAVPTLMRTGSFHHAWFKGNHLLEMMWFTIASTLPGITQDAERAARKMMKACDEGKSFATIGLNARLAQIGFALLPNLVLSAFSLVERFLPKPKPVVADPRQLKSGREIQRETRRKPQTRLGQNAAARWNELKPAHLH